MTDSRAPGGRTEPGSGALKIALHSANPSEGDPSRTRALLFEGQDRPGVPLELRGISAARLRLAAREAAARLLAPHPAG